MVNSGFLGRARGVEELPGELGLRDGAADGVEAGVPEPLSTDIALVVHTGGRERVAIDGDTLLCEQPVC